MTATTYRRRRPVNVQAIEWAGTQASADEITALVGPKFSMIDPEDRGDDPDSTGMLRTTQHSAWVPICTGEWVVKTADGELQAWTAADFLETFEQVTQ
jgi:hypothetical protein